MKLIKTGLLALSLAFAPAALAAPTAAPATAATASTAAPAKPAADTSETPGIAVTPTDPAIGHPVDGKIGLQPQVTTNGEYGLWMHDMVLTPIITVITLLVLGLLVWVMLRYRRGANADPAKFSHNTLIEVIWTAIPILILLVIVVPSIRLLAMQYKPVGKEAITVKAIGNQWYWTYEYPDNGGFEVVSNMLPDAEAQKRGEPRLLSVDNRLVVPVGVPVRLLTTSNDVIHSWAVPAFWTKMDAVPGRTNETSFTIDRPGVYYGQCSELCGARHGFMPIAVQAVSMTDFNAWVAAHGGTAKGAAPAATDNAAAAAPAAAAATPAAPAAAGNAATPAAPAAAAAAATNSTAPVAANAK